MKEKDIFDVQAGSEAIQTKRTYQKWIKIVESKLDSKWIPSSIGSPVAGCPFFPTGVVQGSLCGILGLGRCSSGSWLGGASWWILSARNGHSKKRNTWERYGNNAMIWSTIGILGFQFSRPQCRCWLQPTAIIQGVMTSLWPAARGMKTWRRTRWRRKRTNLHCKGSKKRFEPRSRCDEYILYIHT